MKYTGSLGLVLLFSVIAGSSADAQIIRVQAGSSSLIDADGGSVQLQAPGYDAAFGAGLIANEVQLGGVVRTEFHGLKLTAGDDIIQFNLPTDVFASTQYFYGRGVGVAKKGEKTAFALFGGSTSVILGAPFFQAAKTARPFGLFFLERNVSPRLKFVSRSIVTDKQTFINGLEFDPRRWLKASIGGGVGANAPYGAISFIAERPLFTLRGSYISASRDFRRVSVDTPLGSEVYRDNVLLTMNPSRYFGFGVAREHLLSPVMRNQPSLAATVHQGTVFGNVLRSRLSASLYRSTVGGHGNTGYSFAGTRAIGNHLETGADFSRSKPDSSSASQSLSGRVREIFTQKFSLIQYLGRSNRQTSFHMGGEFNSTRFSVAVTYETVYVPFRAGTAGGPFVQVYNVSVRFRPLQQMELSAQTNVAPDGRLKYTTSGSNSFYRYAGLTSREKRGQLRIGKYVVKGQVIDEDGNPVVGAALQIGGQLTFTDSEGRFFVRLTKRGRASLQVLFGDFLTPQPYEMKSAPSSVEATPEDQAVDVLIILRRVTDPARLLGLERSIPPTRSILPDPADGRTHPPQQH
jgi:hypothetical protein